MMLTSGRERIVRILMRRDGMTQDEAVDRLNDCLDEVHTAIECGDFDLVDDIVAYYLGLEPDYILDLVI